MSSPADFSKLVPGFDFLQNLMKGASAGLPGVGQWVTPTLDPEVLDKRIQELKTVHFWLEQNTKLMSVTIQALEVQRMTLSTLQTMNLPLAEISEALKIKHPLGPPLFKPKPEAAPETAAQPAPAPAAVAASPPPASPPSASATPAAVDPMQWWSTLTEQFGKIASQALKDGVGAAGSAAVQSAGRVTQAADGPALKSASKPAAKTAPKRSRKPASKAR